MGRIQTGHWLGALWGLIVTAGLAETRTCPLQEMAWFDPSSPCPVCSGKPCLLAHLTLHKGRRQSHPEVLRRGGLAVRVSSSSNGKGGWERCAGDGGEDGRGRAVLGREAKHQERGLLLALVLLGRWRLLWWLPLLFAAPVQPAALWPCAGCRGALQGWWPGHQSQLHCLPSTAPHSIAPEHLPPAGRQQ